MSNVNNPNETLNTTSETNTAPEMNPEQIKAAINIDPAILKAAEQLGAGLENDLKAALGSLKLRTAKAGLKNKNIIGGLVGCAAAVGLELLSPTGSKKSAAVAAITSGAMLAASHRFLAVAPESTGVAVAAGTMTFYVGMVGGRITADYFPGNLDIEE